MTRYRPLTQPEPYRAAGTNTAGLLVVQTLRPPRRKARLVWRTTA